MTTYFWRWLYNVRLTQVGLAHRAREVGAAGDVVEVLRLHLLLVGLAVVEVVEVGHDDGHRQRDGEHTGDGAQRPHDLPPHSHRPTPKNHINNPSNPSKHINIIS